MAPTLGDRTWRPSTPETIEHDLAALWREIARKTPVARAVMSNLVVFRAAEQDRGVGAPGVREARGGGAVPGATNATSEFDSGLEAIVARHPSRVLLINHEQGPNPCAPAAASVGVVVFGPPGARYAIEQVTIRSACGEASLPSIIRRLIRGDLPTSILWAEDLSHAPPLQALVTMARQLLYDSRRWRDFPRGVEALAPLIAAHDVEFADLNWRRLTPLRLALVHGTHSIRHQIAAAAVRIVHRPGDGALAWLLAGWLAARLRWAPDIWPGIEEARHGDEVLAITIDDPASAIAASLNGHRAIVRPSGSAPILVGVPHEGEAEAVADELRTLSTDACLRAALSALSRPRKR